MCLRERARPALLPLLVGRGFRDRNPALRGKAIRFQFGVVLLARVVRLDCRTLADLSFLIGNRHHHQAEQGVQLDEPDQAPPAPPPEDDSRRRTIMLNDGPDMQQDGTITFAPVVQTSTLKTWHIIVAVFLFAGSLHSGRRS